MPWFVFETLTQVHSAKQFQLQAERARGHYHSDKQLPLLREELKPEEEGGRMAPELDQEEEGEDDEMQLVRVL